MTTAQAIRASKPEAFRRCYGTEFIAQKVRDWSAAVGAKTAYIEPGSSWENGYGESFNARFRDELRNGDIVYSLKKTQILIETWRIPSNTVRPHSALGEPPPAPESIVPMDQRPTSTDNEPGPPDGGMPTGHAAHCLHPRGNQPM